MKSKKYNWIFFALLLLAIFLRFWHLGNNGIQSDAALNAVRAAGWLDFLVGEGQSSPLVWFGQVPWWANLSFHDHPPLVFLIEHLFIKIYGESSFAVLLPFALAGIGTALLIYFLVRRFQGEQAALWALLIFGVSSYAIWASRSGYLEGIQSFFLILSGYFFLHFLEARRPLFLFFWAASFALALLSKYTAVFLFPAVFVYLLLWDRQVFRSKAFWVSLFLIIILLSPVIFYNFKLYQTRGHFDAALSSMLGMHPKDYEVISSRGVNVHFGNNFLSVIDSLKASGSLPFLFLQLIAWVYLVIILIKGRGDILEKFALLNIVMIVIMFTFAGAQVRFLSIITPFSSIVVASGVRRIFGGFSPSSTFAKFSPYGLSLIVGMELFYAINTNLLVKPVGRTPYFFSSARFYNLGFGELEHYLKNDMLVTLPPKRKINNYEDLLNYQGKSDKVILLDGRADWFAIMWHINRYNFYYDTPIIFFSDFLNLIEKNEDPLQYLAGRGVKFFWFIETTQAGIVGAPGNEPYVTSVDNLLQKIKAGGIAPEKEIKNYRGDVVFRIYHFRVI